MSDTTKTSRMFDLIAPIYGLFYQSQVKRYRAIYDRVREQYDLSDIRSVLDIGCGTGALCSVFEQHGMKVTGIDISREMIKLAAKNNADTDIDFKTADVLQGLSFEDGSFDLVIASYVAHGLKPYDRMQLYREMDRVSAKLVILHDYNETRSWKTTLIEWLERGDYFNFIHVVHDELIRFFGDLTTLQVDQRAAWYIAPGHHQNP